MSSMRVVRLSAEPIIRPYMDERMGSNINGPSLIRVPDWIEEPLGRYYLYFADHKGACIRLACSDAPNIAGTGRPVRGVLPTSRGSGPNEARPKSPPPSVRSCPG